MKEVSTAEFWNTRWQNHETGWDIGYASTPIVEFMKDYPNKSAKILIPGCGNAYEAEYLHDNGFEHITVVDIAPMAVERLQEKFLDKNITVICADFFELEGQYDLIIEQTFFCAIDPERRQEYAKKMYELLVPDGSIVGVLFNTTFAHNGPPFGGNKEEYEIDFNPLFEIVKMEKCYNSIKPRQDKELFIHLKKQTRND